MAVVEKRLLLVRHGQTGPAWQGRYVGATDPPLGENGRRQAARLAATIRLHDPAVCLLSPMRRTRQTAEIILQDLQCPVREVGDLREVDFGRWEGLTFAEITARDQALVNAWAGGEPGFRFPDGEALEDFVGRVRGVLRRIVDCPESDILLVTHGGVIRTLLCLLLDLPSRAALAFDVHPASLALVRCFGDKGMLCGLNLGRETGKEG